MLDEHIAQLIEQVLYTMPGERVNRPTFGTELSRLAFHDLSTEFRSAIEAMMRGALNQWVGELITVESISVTGEGPRTTVKLVYIEKATQQKHQLVLGEG